MIGDLKKEFCDVGGLGMNIEKDPLQISGANQDSMPVARVSSHTIYYWTCTRCNLGNENSFLGSIPEVASCGACGLKHKFQQF